MEEALLQRIERGTKFKEACKIVFQASLEESREWLLYGGYLEGRTVGHVLRYGIPNLGLHFEKEILNYLKEVINIYIFTGIVWMPKESEWYRNCNASDYSWLLTIFIRINGAARIAEGFKDVVKSEKSLKMKLDDFIKNHINLTIHIDSLDVDIYQDDEIGFDLFNDHYFEMGKTLHKDDVLIMKRKCQLIPMSENPTQVFRRIFPQLDLEFNVLLKDDPLEHTIQKIEKMSDFDLILKYLTKDDNPFPGYCPYLPESVGELRSMIIYISCLELIQTINSTSSKLIGKKGELVDEILFSLQKYKTAFVPLLFFMINHKSGPKVGALDDRIANAERGGGVYSNALDKWYPWATTSIHCGDLPNFNHTLTSIALWGPQDIKEKVPIVRTMIKSLPFCCQRRKLIHNISENCMEESYWRVFSSFFWCTLAGLYPWSKSKPGMCGLLRAHYMCSNKEAMMNGLMFEGTVNKTLPLLERTNHTCRIVFTVFREYFLYMASQNKGYVDVATQRMDWDDFESETIQLGNELRRSIRLEYASAEDPFHYARPAMNNAGDSSNTKVNRFRKYPFARTILEKSDEISDHIHVANRIMESHLIALQSAQFEDTIPLDILRRIPSFRKMESIVKPTDRIGFSETIGLAIESTKKTKKLSEFQLSSQIKMNIINHLLRLSPKERLRFEALMDPSLGGISKCAVHVLRVCYSIYQIRSAPKDLRSQLKSVKINDHVVINWYFNILTKIERISLMPLDVATVESINSAMRTNRYCLHPIEILPANAFKIHYSICCGNIKSMPVAEKPKKRAQMIFGAIGVSYNPKTKNYVCIKKVKKNPPGSKNAKPRAPIPISSIIEPEIAKITKSALGKEAAKERKRLNTLPCENQPVLGIDIFGHALLLKSSDGKTTTRYQHCPKCATLHIYKHEYWGASGYMCPYCIETCQVRHEVERCAACQVMAKKGGSKMKLLDVTRSEKDPLDDTWNQYENPLSCFELLHFCGKHSYNAKKDGERGVTKEFMLPHIRKAAHSRKIYNENKYK